MGLLSGFIGGAAKGVGDYADMQLKDAEAERNAQRDFERRKVLAELSSELDTKRAATIEQMRHQYATKDRTDRVQAINGQMGQNADAALADRYADPVQGDEPLTPEQQASQDQGLKQQAVDKERDRLRLMRDPRNMVRAAVETGYSDADVLLRDDTRLQLAALKQEVDNAKTDSARQIALARLEAAQSALDAKLSKADINKPPSGYRATPDGNLQAIPGGPADQKLSGAFNADTAQLTNSTASFDRLAGAANQLLNHPGLSGITGIQGKLPNMPGSDAANAEALLSTLKSQVGFGVLQDMRNNSKTGGALGSVSDAEGKRLEANLSALDKAQSLEQFKQSLGQILDYTEQAKDRLRSSFNMRHGDKPASTPAATSASAPRINSREELDALPSGTTFTAPDGSIRRKP